MSADWPELRTRFVTAVIGMAWQGPTGDTALGAPLELVHNRRVGDNGVLCCGVRDLGILALLGVAEAQSLGEVLKLQEPAKDERVGGHSRTPHLPRMQGHRARTSVWPQTLLQGAGAPAQALML